MADDNRLRSFRTNDPYRRATEPARPSEPSGGSDPLAELARLIGQSDPFAEFGRANARHSSAIQSSTMPSSAIPAQTPQAPPPRQPSPPRYAAQDDYDQQDAYAQPSHDAYAQPGQDAYAQPGDDQSWKDRYSEPARDDWRRTPTTAYETKAYETKTYDQGLDQGHDRREPSFSTQRDPSPLREGRGVGHWYDDPQFTARQSHGHADQRQQQGYAAHGYADQAYADQAYGHAEAQAQTGAEHYADEHYPDQQQGYADAHGAGERTQAEQGEADGYYEDAPLQAHEDESYDDAPRARQRGGLATALALVGCAMLGTAGAYAYRSYYSNPSASQPPPVITADNSSPTKIVPASVGDSQSGKAIQDRMANAGKEQIVSKQEEPVALQELGTQATPRVVLPAPVAPQGAAPMAPAQGGSQSSAAGAANPNGGEPKKVRTVVIRPDGTDVSGKPVGALPPSAAARATPPAPRVTGTTQPAASSGSGPISLDPQTGEPARAAAAPRTRTAAATSGYVVQLSSQKTEAEAQASFRALQAKFPNELGGREAIVRRADLGSKGVFYRTLVGPFGSAQEASQFCASYKSAGGQCVVPSTN